MHTCVDTHYVEIHTYMVDVLIYTYTYIYTYMYIHIHTHPDALRVNPPPRFLFRGCKYLTEGFWWCGAPFQGHMVQCVRVLPCVNRWGSGGGGASPQRHIAKCVRFLSCYLGSGLGGAEPE